jgi:hypothetical protein
VKKQTIKTNFIFILHFKNISDLKILREYRMQPRSPFNFCKVFGATCRSYESMSDVSSFDGRQGCGSGSALIWVAGSGSASRRAKMTHKKRKM